MTLDLISNKQIKEFYSQYDMAYGDVFLTGLGFGILSSWLASKPNVNSVTILEISEDIVRAFLDSNNISEKIKIIVGDASTYKDNNHYDCLFLDHYETQNDFWVFRDAKRVASNIPNHDVFWAWSMEEKMLNNFYKYESFNIEDILSKDETYINSIYSNFKNNVLGIKTMPELNYDTLMQYFRAYYDRIEYV